MYLLYFTVKLLPQGHKIGKLTSCPEVKNGRTSVTLSVSPSRMLWAELCTEVTVFYINPSRFASCLAKA